MKAMKKAWNRFKASRVYYKLFIAEIDSQSVEEMKSDALAKYQHVRWLF